MTGRARPKGRGKARERAAQQQQRPAQQPGPGRPQQGPVQPQPVPVRPQQEPVQPQPGPVRPQQEPVQPQPGPVRPRQEPVQPGPVRPRQEPVQPQPGPVCPRQEPVQPQPGPVRPRQEPVQPQPGPVRPRQEPVQPQPEPVQPQPGSVRPRQRPVRPRKGPVQPQPGPVQPQPGPVQPQPGPVRPPQGPVQPQPGPAAAQPPDVLPQSPPPAAGAEGDIVGPGPSPGVPATPAPRGDELELAAGFQALSVGDRRARRRDYHDLGVNTRQAMEHVKDSKTGVSGKPITLISNHYRLTSRPQWVLYQYHIGFNPQMESRRLRSALLFHHEELLGKVHAFDGTILFLVKRLDKVSEVFSQTRNGENVKITITLTNELPPTSPTCLQFYNIIFRRLLKIMNLQQIGRNYYNPKDPINIPNHRLMIWPGFTTSILQYERSILLCTDVSHKVLRSETVLDFMYNMYSQVDERRFHEICAKELIGLVILTKYNNKTYRIDDIDWDTNPRCTFKKADGSEISFIDYYKHQYNVSVTDESQPVIVSQPKKKLGPEGVAAGPIILIPELCYMTGLTDRMRNDFRVMKDLAIHTRLPPDQRQQNVGRLINYIQRDGNVQKELSDWGLSFDSSPLTFTARVLPTEFILQGTEKKQYNQFSADWTRETRDIPLERPMSLENWLLIYIPRNYNVATELLKKLDDVTRSMMLPLKDPVMIEVDDRIESYLRALKRSVTPETQMVVCVLSSDCKDKYDAIKKYLCIDCPTPSQCVLAKTLSKPHTLKTVATKIALQMNCKMGGELWRVTIPLPKAMIVGIDCYHDTAAGKRSIAGFVASLNSIMTRWYSRCVLQDRGQEIVDDLTGCLKASLKAWWQYNQSLPTRVIIYRDGVGDGQLNTLVKYEVPQFLECLRSVDYGENPRPKLTVIVVKKRLNARFFAPSGGTLQNPVSGTIIDVEVTRPEWYDFFIISQSVREGTVSPTHYNVIYDHSGLKPDHIQHLTYKLCHLYYNWQGTIRVPAPCQYAHKLAFLVGESLHKEPSLSLADRLYYL